MAELHADEMSEEKDHSAAALSKAGAEIVALRAVREDLMKEHKHLAEELEWFKDDLVAYTEAASASSDASATQCKALETALAGKDREIRDLLARLEACHEQRDRERRVGEAEREGREREEQVREQQVSEREREREKDMTGLREEVSAAKIKEAELAAAYSKLQRELGAARAAQEETKTKEAKLEAACAERQCELEATKVAQDDLKTREAELAAACSELEGKLKSLQEMLIRQGQEAVRVQTELEASRAMVKQQADDDAARRERERQRDERQEADRLQVAALREHNGRLGEEVARLEADMSRLQERCAEEQARASKHEEECAALQSKQQEVWAGLRRDLDERVAHLEEQVCFVWMCGSSGGGSWEAERLKRDLQRYSARAITDDSGSTPLARQNWQGLSASSSCRRIRYSMRRRNARFWHTSLLIRCSRRLSAFPEGRDLIF